MLQVVRMLMMVVAVAGIIYALENMEGGFAVWFWIVLLGVGFVGLFYSFRLTQQRMRQERGTTKKKVSGRR
ncbi:MAG: hypothetical protein E7148_04610 [Rikenellaceae bacterium]|nr:hypothetical protein [Rikenellaceae bacterium]